MVAFSVSAALAAPHSHGPSSATAAANRVIRITFPRICALVPPVEPSLQPQRSQRGLALRADSWLKSSSGLLLSVCNRSASEAVMRTMQYRNLALGAGLAALGLLAGLAPFSAEAKL